jgi:hypothetical protein
MNSCIHFKHSYIRVIDRMIHTVPVQHTCNDATINIMPRMALMLINNVLRANSRSLNIFAANGNITLLRVTVPLSLILLPFPPPPDEEMARLDSVRSLADDEDNDDNGGRDDGEVEVGVRVGDARVTTIPPYPGREEYCCWPLIEGDDGDAGLYALANNDAL